LILYIFFSTHIDTDKKNIVKLQNYNLYSRPLKLELIQANIIHAILLHSW